jgi:DNA-binding MarR family transcriptional regulator
MVRSLESLPTWILSAAATRSHQALHQHLAEAGVTGYEYRCLTALAAADRVSQTQLGDAAALDPRDVTLTVRALEGRALVTRERDRSHGRRLLVSLTPAGHRTAESLTSAMAEVQEAVFGRLSTEERSTLLQLLERVG